MLGLRTRGKSDSSPISSQSLEISH